MVLKRFARAKTCPGLGRWVLKEAEAECTRRGARRLQVEILNASLRLKKYYHDAGYNRYVTSKQFDTSTLEKNQIDDASTSLVFLVYEKDLEVLY